MMTRYKKGYRGQRSSLPMWIILIVALLVIGTCSFKLFQANKEYSEGDNAYENITEKATENGIIDFPALSAINPQTVAWINQERMGLDYPVVKGDDNKYYLTHLFDGKVNKLGSIFMDYRNSADFSDQNTVIYGHNMKNGAMFAKLTDYKDKSVFDANPTLKITTPTETLTMKIFSVYTIDTKDFTATTSFNSDVEFIKHINEEIGRSFYATGVSVKPSDRIVTLYTCTYDYDNARFILVGAI